MPRPTRGSRSCGRLPGVGEFTALVMLAEIGDISRFGSARKLASWAGLTPTVRGSDRKRTRLNSSHLGISYAVFCLKKNEALAMCGAQAVGAGVAAADDQYTLALGAYCVFFLMIGRPPRSTLFPYTPLFR